MSKKPHYDPAPDWITPPPKPLITYALLLNERQEGAFYTLNAEEVRATMDPDSQLGKILRWEGVAAMVLPHLNNN